MTVEAINIRDLLESGVHFGHKSSTWNPKMKKYIYMKKKGVHIIDLQKTVELASAAYQKVRDVVSQGGRVLFVGTKKQARTIIHSAAQECDQFHVTNRWIGGLLTNFNTVQSTVAKLKSLEAILENELERSKYAKKQLILIEKKRNRMNLTLGGIKEMITVPDLIFVVDAGHEEIALKEAKIMGIPTVGLVDTNSDPDLLDYVIPGNDDAVRAVSLFVQYITKAVKEGKGLLQRDPEVLKKLQEMSEAKKEIQEATHSLLEESGEAVISPENASLLDIDTDLKEILMEKYDEYFENKEG